MKKKLLKECKIDLSNFTDIICIGLFGSYHESCFIEGKSDIDIMILSSKELSWEEEFELEDYLQSILPQYFSYGNIHYTFINGFVYPFSELLLISKDKIIFKEDSYLDYVLGYSSFKRDRENLEIIREENLKDLEVYRRGLL